VEPGEEVLIPQPSFVCYEPMAQMVGAVPVIIETKEKDGFRLTPEELRAAVTPKTKLLVLPFPNNPTGAVMRKKDLEAIADVIRGTNLIVLSDEIYSELTYGDQPHVAFSSLPDMRERTIVVNGFSKAFAMTGWRLGYAMGPKELIAQMTKLHQYAIMSAPTTSQYAAVEAMRHGDADIVYMREQYDMRRRLIVDGFNEMNLTCFEPEGAFYVFPCIKRTGLSSDEFCEKLLYAKHVAVVPGSAFGNCGEGYVRVSYSYSINHITEALSRIHDFLKQLGC
jgi:aminotransferase